MKREETIQFAKECFKNHVAKFTQINEHTQELEWGNPNSSAYYIRYVFNGNRVFVCGDVGDAVYSLTERADIKKIAKGYELSYFTGKLTASENGKYSFDSNTAIERLTEEKENDKEDSENGKLSKELNEAYREIFKLARESSTIDEWHLGLRENEDYALEIDQDWWEWMSNAGNELRQSIVMFWFGIKMAAQQLGYEVKYI